MKKYIALALIFLLTLCMIPAMAEAAAIDTKVAEIDEYGHAKLDITR